MTAINALERTWSGTHGDDPWGHLDLRLTDTAMSYDATAARRSVVEVRANPLARAEKAPDPRSVVRTEDGWPKLESGEPDFGKMNSEQRRAYDAWRLEKRFG